MNNDTLRIDAHGIFCEWTCAQSHVELYFKSDNWEKRKAEIIGNNETENTIAYYNWQLKSFDKLPPQLEQAKNDRMDKSKEINF